MISAPPSPLWDHGAFGVGSAAHSAPKVESDLVSIEAADPGIQQNLVFHSKESFR